MLKLTPNCEHCDLDLPTDSKLARICSFECTFCVNCVENLLSNCCPNCGGSFQVRPVRPVVDFKNDNRLQRYPAQKQRLHSPVNLELHRELIQKVRKYTAINKG